VPVAEGVHVEDVGVGGGKEEVLREGVEHVPGVQVHQGGDDVEAPGRGEGEDDQTGVGDQHILDKTANRRRVELVPSGGFGKGVKHQVEGEHQDVRLDETKDDEG